MVFCGLFPIDGDELPDLRDALDKLKLNDASFTFEPESSRALGFGFRCGFLGLLHMEIVRERLEREFDLSLIATAPSVAYVAHLTDGGETAFANPTDMPEPSRLDHVDEPMLRGHRARPLRVHRHRDGSLPGAPGRARAHGLPVARAARARVPHPARRGGGRLLRPAEEPHPGYASLDYEPAGSQTAALVKVDVLINHTPVDAFSTVVHKSQADTYGRRMTTKLRADPAPDVRRAHSGGGRRPDHPRETVKAKRKDVIAKCYGGDITRKRKLLRGRRKEKRR